MFLLLLKIDLRNVIENCAARKVRFLENFDN